MGKYGYHIGLLDATYETTKYAIPLFFVVVKTNSDYQVVASFAVQDEMTAAITESRWVFQKTEIQAFHQNISWLIIAEDEITWIETVFPGKASLSIF